MVNNSDFWIGFASGFIFLIVLCFIVASKKGPYLQIKTNKFFTQVIKNKNKQLAIKASKQLNGQKKR